MIAGAPIPAGSAIRILAYLDSHILLNRIKTAARNPLRLIIWLVFLLAVVSILQARLTMNQVLRSRPLPGPGEEPPPPFFFFQGATPVLHTAATFVPAIILVAFGLFILAARRQPLATFRSAADARFLSGSLLPPRLVVVWLMVRVILALGWRIPLIAAFFLLFLPTFALSAGTGIIVIVALVTLGLTLTLNVPIFVSQQRRIGPNPGIIGWLLLLIGIAALVSVFMALSPGSPILPSTFTEIAASLPPGSWLVGAFKGNVIALLPLAALAAGSLALTWLVAGDIYPELWQASARMIVLRRAVRSRGPLITSSERRRLLKDAGVPDRVASGRQNVASSRGRWVPTGAWTMLWKEWLATRRVAGGMRWPAITLLVAVAVGAAIGVTSRIGLGGAISFMLAPLAYFGVFVSFFTAFRMGGDLRKPIWWLSASSLGARLTITAVARSLRFVVPIAAGLGTATVLSANLAFVLVGVPLVGAIIFALNAMAIAIYAIIPSSADMRGPGGMLRGCLVVAMLVPIGILALIGGIAAGGYGALVMVAAAAVAEGLILVLFATSRLEGNGLAFAQAERR